MKVFLVLLAFIALVVAQQLEKCPPPKTIVIKRIHTVVCPSNIPYPVYKELPFDGKPLTQCPPGYTLDGPKRCVHIVKSTDICPTTYSRISDDECIKVVVLDTVEDHALACPPNYVFDKKVGCSLEEDLKLKFPKLPPIVAPKDPKINILPKIKPIKCPFGYRKVGAYKCVKSIGCSKGFKLRKGRCVRSLKCKAGELIIANKCILANKCPIGLSKVGGACVKVGRKNRVCRFALSKKWSKKRKIFSRKLQKKFYRSFLKQRASKPKKFKIIISKKWSKKRQVFARKIQLIMLCMWRPRKATRKSFFAALKKRSGKVFGKVSKKMGKKSSKKIIKKRRGSKKCRAMKRAQRRCTRYVIRKLSPKKKVIKRKIIKRKIVKKIKNVKPKKAGFCQSTGDPHFVTFTGEKFDNYQFGDFVVVDSSKFTVHTRQLKWSGASVNTRFAVRVNFEGDRFQVNNQNSVLLNGKKVSLPIGKTIKAPHGGNIHRFNTVRFKITGVDGSFLDAHVNKAPKGVAWPQEYYTNMLIWVPNTRGTKGFCVSKKQVLKARGLFKHFVPPKKVKKVACPADKLALATQQCVAAKVFKRHLKACALDVCLSGGKLNPVSIHRFEKRCNKDKKKFKKRQHKKSKKSKKCANKLRHTTFCKATGLKAAALKACVKKLCKKVKKTKPLPPVKPIKKITCDLYADPHVRSFDGKYFEAQTVGDWVLHDGPTIKASYRGKSFGRWIGVVDWIAHVNGDKIRSVGFTKVSVNDKVVPLVNGKALDLPHGGSILQIGNKFTISSKKGEEVDFVSFKTFFNAYVRSSLPNVSGLCSHQFVRSKEFDHPRKGVKLPKPKLNCPQKNKHLKSCKAKGLKGHAALNCAFDLCAKFPKELEKKIIKLNKKENKKPTPKPKPKFVPIKRITCDLYADPHVKDFNGKLFEAQTVGDYVLHDGPTLKVSYRGKSFGRWIGVVQWIVNVKGDVVRNIDFKTVSVNGNPQPLISGKPVALPKGGVLTQTGSKFNINSGNGEDVDFITFGAFFNAYVRSNQSGVTGLCSHQFIKSTQFEHPRPGKVLPPPKVKCANKAKHLITCAGKGLKGQEKLNCVFDLCAKFPKELETKIIADNKKEEKKHAHRLCPVKRVTCDLYADPHARSFDGKYFEAQTEGDWVLHDGPTMKLSYRGKRFGRWIGVVEWIANIKGDIVRNNGFTGFTVNGKPAAGTVNLPNGGVVSHVGKKITINSKEGEEADFISYRTFFNAYVRSNLLSVSGLCSHQFIRSTAFGHPQQGVILPAPQLNCAAKAAHMKTCAAKGLTGDKQLNCVFDLCAKFPKAIELKIIRDNKKENKKPIRR